MTFDLPAALAALKSGATLTIPAGTYDLHKTPTIPQYLGQVTIQSDGGPVIIKKAPGFVGEYLFWLKGMQDIKLSGLQFFGLNSALKFGEQLVYFGSCKGTEVTGCHFEQCGDAALRITTSMQDAPGTHSQDAHIHRNTFKSIGQITVTSDSDLHGGTENFLFENNQIESLFGSLKFATRIPCGGAEVCGNTISGSADKGLEIGSYSNLEAYGNVITGTHNAAVFAYPDTRAPKGFEWGGLNIHNNVLGNCGAGVRIGNDAFKDGFHQPMKGLAIVNNALWGIAGPLINLVNGSFLHPDTTGNVNLAGETQPITVRVPA